MTTYVIEEKRGTAANMALRNIVLADGQMGIEIDTRKFKFGDGTSHWNDLLYAGAANDPDLDAIAIIDSNTENVIVSTGAGWLGKSWSQLKTLMTFGKADVGLGNVDNVADASKTFTAAQIISGLLAAARVPSLDALTAPAANVDANGHKFINVANGTASGDAVNFGQLSALIANADAVVYKGGVDCSANPNYPAADAGWLFKVTVAGKIGGASGPNVEVGDALICSTDGTTSGTQAAVGANWDIFQVNVDGAVVGPATSNDSDIALFNGSTGKVIKDSGKVISTDGTFASNSDAKVPTEKAAKSYVDAAVVGAAVAEFIRDTMGAALVAGTGIAITVDDAGDTITITSTGGAFSQTIGDGVTTTFNITHGLGTKAVVVQVWDSSASTWEAVDARVRAVSTSVVQVVFSTAPTTNQVTVVIQSGGGPQGVIGLTGPTGGTRVASPSGHTLTSWSIQTDAIDVWDETAQAANVSIAIDPASTLGNTKRLLMRIASAGTFTLTWSSDFKGAMPTSTVAGKELVLGFLYNAANAKFELIGQAVI